MAAEGIVTMTNLHRGNSRCTCLDQYSLHYEETRKLGHASWCPLMLPEPAPPPVSNSKDTEIASLRADLEKQVKLSFAAGWRACNKVNEFPWNETAKELLEADWAKYAKARARKDTK